MKILTHSVLGVVTITEECEKRQAAQPNLTKQFVERGGRIVLVSRSMLTEGTSKYFVDRDAKS